MKYAFHYDMPAVCPEKSLEVAIQASCKLRVETRFAAMFVAVPNGGKREFYGQRLIKKEGVKKGFPDAIIIGHGANAGKIAFAEIKARGSMSLEQHALLDHMHRNGHDVGLFRSQDTIEAWLRSKGWQ